MTHSDIILYLFTTVHSVLKKTLELSEKAVFRLIFKHLKSVFLKRYESITVFLLVVRFLHVLYGSLVFS